MKQIISKFTMGKPRQLVGPVLWLFIESFFMAAPAILIYYVMDLLIRGFHNPSQMDISQLWVCVGIAAVIFIIQIFIKFRCIFVYLSTWSK